MDDELPERHRTAPPSKEEPLVWVVLSPELVPERWRHRGRDAVVVPLLPREAEAVLRGEPAAPELGPEDEDLMELVAGGVPVAEIALRLEITARGVQHRLARLRRRFDVASTADLGVLAGRWGFGPGPGVKQRAKGIDEEHRE